MSDTDSGSSWRDTVTEFTAEVSGRNWLGGLTAAVMSLFVLPIALLTPALQALPPAWKLYHKIHTWSAYKMQKAANADTLANVRRPNDKEDVLPAKYVEGGEDDKDLSGWKIKGLGGKRYETGVRGGASSRFGKASIIHVNEDDLEQGTWTEATIDNAFKLDRERYLFRDADVDVNYTIDASNMPQGQAVADGGQNVQQSARVSVESPGILQDVLVPITSRAGYDGQVVSWNSYSQLKNEKADQEQIRQAKNSGWMAAKLDDIDGTDLMKWAIILGLAGFVLLFHNDIGAFIAGLGGGGGSVGDAASGALGMMNFGKAALGVF